MFGRCFVVGLAIKALLVTAWVDATVIWTDFIHHNPNRPPSNALFMLATSPIEGVLGSLALTLIAVIVGALLMAAAIRAFGRLQLWVAIGVAPLCAAACGLQGAYLFPSDSGEIIILAAAAGLTAARLPFLVGCWLLSRRLMRNRA
jgi:hypothetical protein